jgi:hypothetical protein
MGWVGYEAGMEEMGNAYEILIGKPEGRRTLGKIDIGGRILLEWILGEGWEDVDWIQLA